MAVNLWYVLVVVGKTLFHCVFVHVRTVTVAFGSLAGLTILLTFFSHIMPYYWDRGRELCMYVCVCVCVCVIVPNPLLNGALMRLYQAALLLSSHEGCGFVFCESLTLLHTHTHTHTHSLSNTHSHIRTTSDETTASAQCVTRAQASFRRCGLSQHVDG